MAGIPGTGGVRRADQVQGPEDLWQEKQRQDALTRMGWRIERFIWADFTHLDVLRDRILALFPATVARSARPVADLWR